MAQKEKLPNQRLKAGTQLLIQPSPSQPGQGIPASVSKVTDDGLWLELSDPGSAPTLEAGQKVRLKHWDEGAVYYYDVEVQEISGRKSQHVAVSLPIQPVSIQRRSSQRLQSAVSLSFRVVEASHRRLVSEQVHKSATMDISAGGMRFETNLPFKEGDHLEITLALSRSKQIAVGATVTACDKIEQKGKMPYAARVEFHEFVPEDREAFLEFLAKVHSIGELKHRSK